MHARGGGNSAVDRGYRERATDLGGLHVIINIDIDISLSPD
jgi:hypothetical protein